MKRESPWRKSARRVIKRVIADVGRDDPKRLRKALRAAYPFGETKYWPYKVWLSECKRQMRPDPPLDDSFLPLFELGSLEAVGD